MKKFKKVLSMVAACTMAMAMLIPAAVADVTVYVEKPAEWDAVCLWPWTVMKDGSELDATFNPDVVPSAWPGWQMKVDDASGYYTYTMACDSFNCCFANTEGSSQTGDITDVSGTKTFSAPKLNADNKYDFTMTDGAPTGTAAKGDATPKTGDFAPIAIVAVIGLVSVAVVVATRKKAVA